MGPEGFMQPPSRTRARFVVVTLLIAAAAAVPALAQTAPWPAGSDEPMAASPPIVTVAPFQAGRSTRLSVDTTAALADELAAKLVESHRCRVLDQAWLPVRDGATKGRSVRTLRDAAASAGVDYLVIGNIVPLTRTIVIPPRASGLPRPTLGGIGIAGRHTPVAIANAMRPGKIRRSLLRITLRVIDVRTGETINSVLVESPVGGSALPALGLLPIPGISWPVRAVVAATAIGRSGSTLDAGLREAMASAARTISASSFLQAGVRESSALDSRGGQQ
jgi:hypothetical protein